MVAVDIHDDGFNQTVKERNNFGFRSFRGAAEPCHRHTCRNGRVLVSAFIFDRHKLREIIFARVLTVFRFVIVLVPAKNGVRLMVEAIMGRK